MEGRTSAVTKGRRVDVNRSIAKYGIVLVIFYFERWLEFMVTLYFFFFFNFRLKSLYGTFINIGLMQ